MWSRLKVSVAPTSAPITLSEAKAHLRVDASDEDALIQRLINSAVAKIDGVDGIGYCMMTQTWVATLDAFPAGTIVLPLAPFNALVSIAYTDTSGNPQTMDAADYNVVGGATPAFVEPIYGGSWPSARDVSGAVSVTFRVGSATAAEVPGDLVEAMFKMIESWFEVRGDVVVRHAVRSVPGGVAETLERYRVGVVAA